MMPSPDEFDELVSRVDGEDPAPSSRDGAGRPLLVLSIAAVLVGVLLAGTGALVDVLVPAQPGSSPLPASRAEPEGGADEQGEQARSSSPAAATPDSATGSAGVTAALEPRIDPQWLSRIAAAGRIPERALVAYAQAAARMAREQPNCGLGWNTLAGIGFVESEHGTIDGSSIGADGFAAPPIIGVPLDGRGTDAIPDIDGGVLDGDVVWDRALGPMQFIPSTWALWGSDGSGDGIANVHSIDDAAYSAARYLCAFGGDLRQPSNWIRAIAAYNDTIDYNHRVAEAASFYAAL